MKKIYILLIVSLLFFMTSCFGGSGNSSNIGNGGNIQNNDKVIVLTKDNVNKYVKVSVSNVRNNGNTCYVSYHLQLPSNVKGYSNLSITVYVSTSVSFVTSAGKTGDHNWRTLVSFDNTHTATKNLFIYSNQSVSNILNCNGYMTSVVSASGKLYLK